MSHTPLGTKLTLWSALIVMVALIASALASDIFVYRTERQELDRELRNAAHHFFEQYRVHGSALEWVMAPTEMAEVFPLVDESRFVLVRAMDGRAIHRSANMPLGLNLPTRTGIHNALIGTARVRLGVFREDGITLFLAGDTAEFTQLIARLVIGHLVALPVVLAVVALGGWWLGGRALQPVKAVADAVESIQPDDLDRRLPETAQTDEIGRLARVFNRMIERLQRGFQQATRFSTDASHELRTPLTVLRGSIEELLEDRTLTEGQRAAVGELQLQTHRLISITNTLLLLARADAGRLHLQLEDADLREIVADCLDDARILGEQRGVRIEDELGEAAPVRVEPGRIRQVVLNLLDNAVRYNVAGGRVQLAILQADGQFRLRIGNTGPGIPPEEQAGLFARFFRARQQEDTPGAGLGLSLARELARSHAGDVVLVGSREGWTEFELSLPLRAEPERDQSAGADGRAKDASGVNCAPSVGEGATRGTA